jgi:predicted transposase/invertase (TIGR01784 family)
MPDKYIDLLTDFGFKKIFGEEANKELLIDFLNSLLEEEKGKITQITYLKTEKLGMSQLDRKAIYDIYCESETGEKFIVELQKAEQAFFKERSIYYATFPIQEQAVKGDWNFKFNAIYTIAIMDFTIEKESTNYIHRVKLMNTETKEIFSDKLNFIYLEIPKFNKQEAELESHFDKWIYLIKNLAKIENVSEKLQEKIFKEVFELGEIAKYDRPNRQVYEDSLKAKRDWKNSLDTSFEKGIEQGIEKTQLEIARNAKEMGLNLDSIIKLTGLSKEEIEKL